MLPKNFNWQFYLSVNPDLRDAGLTTKQDAESHWVNHGHKEGRTYKPLTPTDISLYNIINVYHDKSTSGIGDFLRGCIFLREQNRERFNISYSCHPISKYISSEFTGKINPKDIVDIYHQTVANYGKIYSLDKLKETFYYTIQNTHPAIISSMYSPLLYPAPNDIVVNNFLNHTINETDRIFLQNNIKFDYIINHAFKELNLSDYNVVHVRLGDHAALQNKLKIKDPKIINQLNYKNFNIDQEHLAYKIFANFCKDRKKTILLSDNNQLKKTVSQLAKNLKLDIDVIHTKSNHCSNKPGLVCTHNDVSEAELFYVALDMKIMSKASSISGYSVYPWGSGFSYAMAKIYDIPLTIEILE